MFDPITATPRQFQAYSDQLHRSSVERTITGDEIYEYQHHVLPLWNMLVPSQW